jgi:hypothetical protein
MSQRLIPGLKHILCWLLQVSHNSSEADRGHHETKLNAKDELSTIAFFARA